MSSRQITLHGITLSTPAVVALIGAGGKTSLLFWLAQQLKHQGLRVLCTTTTRMYLPTTSQCDTLILDDNPATRFHALKKHAQKGHIVYCASVCKPLPDKVTGLSTEEVDWIKASQLFDVCLVEADGARGLPIKSPASHEPAIPKSSDVVVALTSAEVLLQPADPQLVHRWELFSAIAHCHQGELMDADVMCRFIKHTDGLFKNTPDNAQRIWVINKIDLAVSIPALKKLASTVFNNSTLLNAIWLTTMQGNPSLSIIDPKTPALHWKVPQETYF